MHKKIKEHKIKGQSYLDFEKIGIPAKMFYNLSKKNLSEKQILNKAFIYKYGKPIINKNHQFVNYYCQHLKAIAYNKQNNRAKKIKELRNDFFDSGNKFGFRDSYLAGVWESITVNHYLNETR